MYMPTQSYIPTDIPSFITPCNHLFFYAITLSRCLSKRHGQLASSYVILLRVWSMPRGHCQMLSFSHCRECLNLWYESSVGASLLLPFVWNRFHSHYYPSFLNLSNRHRWSMNHSELKNTDASLVWKFHTPKSMTSFPNYRLILTHKIIDTQRDWH